MRVLGEDIVLYRRSDGRAVALEDACPHRKLPLSQGRIQGDLLECGYHGLRFDCSGRCVKVPGTDHIPAAALVRAFPLENRYGLLWIWMGEPAGAARPAQMPLVTGLPSGGAHPFAANPAGQPGNVSLSSGRKRPPGF